MRKPFQWIVKRDGNQINPFSLNTIIFVFIIKKEGKPQKTNLLIYLSNKMSSVIFCTVLKMMGDNPDVNYDNNIGSKNKAFYLKEYQALIPLTQVEPLWGENQITKKPNKQTKTPKNSNPSFLCLMSFLLNGWRA